MKLLIDRLTETPQAFTFEADAAFRARLEQLLPEAATAPAESSRVELRAGLAGRDVVIDGVVEGAFSLECGRCLARYGQRLRESFRLVLEPAGDRVPADPEAAAALERDGICLGDEPGIGWYAGPEVDLDSVVVELMQLALPVQPLCREDCRGLCPRCGLDRNVEDCRCEAAGPESPFAVLRALRGTSTEGDQ
jgi:uncharacterized protein